MKKSSAKATDKTQKSDSKKQPAMTTTARTQKTPADERNDPSFMSDESGEQAEAMNSIEGGGFHPPSETRREKHAHEKGEAESKSIKSRVPPAQKPGDPGSAPRIMQRRKVYERGNRYPLTHAPKS